MGLMDKARQTAEQARAGMLGERSAEDVDPDAPPPPPPSARAGAALNTFIGVPPATATKKAAPAKKAAKKRAPRPIGP